MGEVEVVIGADANERTHTFVAADEMGREVASKTVVATTAGHMQAVAWAATWPAQRWALEDCRHLKAHLGV
jgi:transposase